MPSVAGVNVQLILSMPALGNVWKAASITQSMGPFAGRIADTSRDTGMQISLQTPISTCPLMVIFPIVLGCITIGNMTSS